MTSVSHALIGAAIASRVVDPFTVAVIAFTTHFVCDAIPHWDLGTNWRGRSKRITGTLAIAETMIAVFGSYLLFMNFVPNKFALALGIFFSVLPDLLQAPYYMFKNAPSICVISHNAQSAIHERLQAPWGVLTQVATVAAFLWVGYGMH